MSKMDFVRDRIANTLKAAQPRASLEFQSAAKVDNGAFKVVMSVQGPVTESAIAEEVASQTGGLARVVPGSLVRRGEVAVAFVKANNVSKLFDPNVHTMMTASTAHASDDGRIWNVVNDGSSKRVVLEAGDDLEGIFAERIRARKNILNPAQGQGLAVASFNNGDCVRYVDTASGDTKVALAFNVGGAPMVVGQDGVPHTVVPLQIIAAVPRSSLPAPFQGAVKSFETRASLSPEKFTTIVDYLKKAYGEASGPMLDRLKELHQAA